MPHPQIGISLKTGEAVFPEEYDAEQVARFVSISQLEKEVHDLRNELHLVSMKLAIEKAKCDHSVISVEGDCCTICGKFV